MESLPREISEKIIKALIVQLDDAIELVKMQEGVGGRYPIKNQFVGEVIEEAEVDLTEYQKEQLVTDILMYIVATLEFDLFSPERNYISADGRFVVVYGTSDPFIYFRTIDYPDGSRECEISSEIMPDEDDPLAG